MKRQRGYFDWAFALCILGIFLAVALLAWGIYYSFTEEAKRPGFELKKGDWACTLYAPNSTTYVKSGDIMIPIETGGDCRQWTKVRN